MAFHDAGLGLIDGSPEGQAVRGLLTFPDIHTAEPYRDLTNLTP
jgi:hypothetical protein